MGCELNTTNLIEEQLKSLKPDLLRQLGLNVVDLDGVQVSAISHLRRKYEGPDAADLSALVLAKGERLLLVTRDGPLAEAAKTENVAVRDTLWLLRKLVASGVLSASDAATALETMQKKRVRRPIPAWGTQIKKWRAQSR